MVRKLFPPMGTSHLFFIYIFSLKEHLNTISTRRPTFKPNSLRGCVRTTFCDVYPLPKVLELLRKNVGLSWPSVGLQEAHLQRILSGMQEGRDSDGDHCQGHPRSRRNGGGLCGGGGAHKTYSENRGRRRLPTPALQIGVWERLGGVSTSLAAKPSLPIPGFPGVCGIYRNFRS